MTTKTQTIKSKISSLFSVEGFMQTLRRFPVPVFCSVILYVILFGEVNDIWSIPRDFGPNIMTTLIVGFFFSGAVTLFCEARGYNARRTILAGIASVFVMALLVMTIDRGEEFRYFALTYAAISLVLVAPFVARKGDDLSFWVFSKYVCAGAVFAFVAALILFGGASGALASIGYLFEIKIRGDVYTTLWLFGSILVAPLYALSFVPQKFDVSAHDNNLPPQVGFIANWILAPLVAIYIAILYAYFIKIGVTGEIPKNQLAYMIAGFASAGIVTYLLAWPCVQEQKAGKLLRGIMRYLFPILLIPTVVMIYAIGVRISEYGVTEKRYIVVVAALWLVFLIVGFMAKKMQLKDILLSFAVLLIIATVGPWSMTPVSQASQFNRLEAMLMQHDIIQEGEIVKAEKDIPYEDRRSISSQLQYVERTKYYDDVLAWVTDEQRDAMKNDMYANKELRAHQITDVMGFKFINRYEQAAATDRFNINIPRQDMQMMAVRGYDYVLPNMNVFYNEKSAERGIAQEKSIGGKGTGGQKNKPKVTYGLDEAGVLTITVEGRGAITFDVNKVAQDNHDPKLGYNNPAPVSVVLEKLGRGMKMRLVFKHISGKIEGNTYKVGNASFSLFLDL